MEEDDKTFVANFKRKVKRRLNRADEKNTKQESILQKLEALPPTYSDSSSSSSDCMVVGMEEAPGCGVASENADSDSSMDAFSESDRTAEFMLSDDDVHENDNEPQIPDLDESDSRDGDGSDNDALGLQFQNNEEREQYVVGSLREWALEGGVLSMKKLDCLLARLKPVFPNLPVSYKTLLETPRNIDVIPLDPGELWYKSIKSNLDSMDLHEYLEVKEKIVLNVNMDGLPLSKSSKVKFWPILGHLAGSKSEPFIIAIYLGKQDPGNVNEFLAAYVNEVEYLMNHGYDFDNNNYAFEVSNYILDAPARALMKCCINHGGYAACDKCTVFGEWHDDRMTYTNLDEPLRTDTSFLAQEQPRHHTGHSPLERLKTGMVSQFRLDVMHLVYEGVFKRLLTVWREWNGAWKLHWRAVDSISELLESLIVSVPQDFNRKPRTLKDMRFYKATEFRRLLLYDGMLVFRDFTESNIYKHFLLLHCGMFILSHPVLVNSMHEYAGQVLRAFIEHSVKIYGKKFVVYNVHVLLHLAAECVEHGVVENFSAFKFENRLKSLKSSLRSVYRPLHQAARRDLERQGQQKVLLEKQNNEVSLSKEHSMPDEILEGTQYKHLCINNVVFQLNQRDNCFRASNGDTVLLKNIVRRGEDVFVIGCRFKDTSDFYDYPLQSSQLGIENVSDLDETRRVYNVTDIKEKCWLMPDGCEKYLCVPLLHTIPVYH